MRRQFTILAFLAVLNTAQAQWQALTPTPFGVAMTVGQWLWSNNKNVYFIEVRGQGSTTEEARMNGFRLAVEQALGSVIASETEQQNSRIRRDEVISYAAGFVERHEIVNSMNTGSGYEIAMRVWVKRTNLAERLLVKSKADGKIDGARAAIAVETAQYSRLQGDRLLASVLQDFPVRSFDIKLKPTRVEIDSNRNTKLIVPFMITWNKKYVDSYYAADRATSTCGWNGCVQDKQTIDLIFDEIVHSRPHILITINSLAGAVQYRDCYPLETKYIVDSSERWIHDYFVPVSKHNLTDMSQVEVRVVRAANCPSNLLGW